MSDDRTTLWNDWPDRPRLAGLLAGLRGHRREDRLQGPDRRRQRAGHATSIRPTPSTSAGSFDITEFEIDNKGDKVDISTSPSTRQLEDPWRMGTGFSVQMVFIFIRPTAKASGFTDTVPPGLNVTFAPGDAVGQVCVILSPQPPARVQQRGRAKAGAMAVAIIVSEPRQGRRPTISASVDLAQLGGGDPTKWGYQVVMQSNEGFPARQRPADPQGQRVRGPAPLRRRHRLRLRSARHGHPRRQGRGKRGRGAGAARHAQVRMQPGRHHQEAAPSSKWSRK